MKKHSCFLCILFVFPVLAWAFDFGVILDQSVGLWGAHGNHADYKGSLVPRFSTLFGEEGELIVSAGIYAEQGNKNWTFVPEVLRTEFSWLFDNGDLKIGRMYYSDPFGFIAEGLFDGARLSYDTNLGTFSAGAWYTGFLYKRRANIAMTGDELQSNHAELDYGDFFNSYFAPRRFVSALDWEHSGLMNGYLIPRFSVLGQFDLSGNALHSQYLIGYLALPINAFLFNLGGSFELIQDSEDSKTAWAAEIRAAWALPTPFASRVSLLGRYSSGASEDGGMGAFLPLTAISQGFVLRANLSGVSMISLDYFTRLHRTFTLGVSSSYFMRSDLGTYNSYPISAGADDGHILGNEFFAQLLWSPVSDLSINMGYGIFLPSMGNAAPEAAHLWRAELNLVLSLY